VNDVDCTGARSYFGAVVDAAFATVFRGAPAPGDPRPGDDPSDDPDGCDAVDPEFVA
jgi:hypothetical protein